MRSVVGTHEEVGEFETIESLCAAVSQDQRCEIAAVFRTLRISVRAVAYGGNEAPRR